MAKSFPLARMRFCLCSLSRSRDYCVVACSQVVDRLETSFSMVLNRVRLKNKTSPIYSFVLGTLVKDRRQEIK